MKKTFIILVFLSVIMSFFQSSLLANQQFSSAKITSDDLEYSYWGYKGKALAYEIVSGALAAGCVFFLIKDKTVTTDAFAMLSGATLLFVPGMIYENKAAEIKGRLSERGLKFSVLQEGFSVTTTFNF